MNIDDVGLVATLLDLVCEGATHAVANESGTPRLDDQGLAQALGVSLAEVDRLCRAGQIPYIRSFDYEEVVRALRARKADERARRARASKLPPGVHPRPGEQ